MLIETTLFILVSNFNSFLSGSGVGDLNGKKCLVCGGGEGGEGWLGKYKRKYKWEAQLQLPSAKYVEVVLSRHLPCFEIMELVIVA